LKYQTFNGNIKLFRQIYIKIYINSSADKP